MTQYQEILESADSLVVEINPEGYIQNWWLFNDDPSVTKIIRPDLSEFFWSSEHKGWTYYKVVDGAAVFDTEFSPLPENMRITVLDANNKAISQEWKPYYKNELITPVISDFGINIWQNDQWVADFEEGRKRVDYVLRQRRTVLFAGFDILKINLRIDSNGFIHPDTTWNPELINMTQDRWDSEFKIWYLKVRDLDQEAIGFAPEEVLYYANLV